MKIGDEIYVHGYIDEIRKDIVIIKNDGGYFGTVEEEIKNKSEIPTSCDDAISRKSMLDYIKYLHGEMPKEEFVKALPSVTPAPKKDVWIPCSERLPEPKETENLIAKYYLVQNEYGDMIVARWDGNGWEQMYQHEYLEDDVIAWMPLPEPYREESEDA